MNKLLFLLKKGTQSEGLRASSLTVVGDVGAAGISAIALILLSRILGPTAFGQFSVAFSLILILARLGDWGLGAASLKFIAQEREHQRINSILSFVVRTKVRVIILFSFVGLCIHPFIAKQLGFTNPPLIGLAFLFLGSLAFYEQLQVTLQSLHLFGKAVLINLIQSGFKLCLVLVLLFFDFHSAVVAFAFYSLATMLPVILSKWLLPSWVSLSNSIPSSLRRNILDMVKHSSIAFVAAGFIENIDVLFVQKYADSYTTGLYSGVNRISLMVAMIAFSLASVLNARVARYHDHVHRKEYLKKVLLLNILAVLGFILFVPLAKWIVLFTIGPEYLPALPQLLILTGGSCVLFAAVPWVAMFYSFNTNWYFSFAGIMQLVIMVTGNMVLTPELGITGAALTKLATRISLLVLSAGLALYLYGKKSQEIT